MTRNGKVFWILLSIIIWTWLGSGVYISWTTDTAELWFSIVSSIMLPLVALMLTLVFHEIIRMLDEAFKEDEEENN